MLTGEELDIQNLLTLTIIARNAEKPVMELECQENYYIQKKKNLPIQIAQQMTVYTID